MLSNTFINIFYWSKKSGKLLLAQSANLLQSTVKWWKSSATGQLHPSSLDRLLGQLICAAYDFNTAKVMANNGNKDCKSHEIGDSILESSSPDQLGIVVLERLCSAAGEG